MADINVEIKKHIGVIATGSRGWNKELNIVSWNNGKPKYDIREWDENHEKMGRGTTLTEDEAVALMTLLREALC